MMITEKKGLWQGQRILIIGAARQGLALARYLARHGARVTVTDQRPAAEMQAAVQSLADLPVEWALGSHPQALLEGVDLVCVSGGVPLSLPLIVEARQVGIRLSNDAQIFLETVPCPVIGITGSAGKTTTTTLVGRIASAAAHPGKKVWVGGNIGLPLVVHVDEMQPDDLVIMELSSFQLDLMTLSPQVSAILNVSPNHLDRHGSMENYTSAKARILDYQTHSDTAILNRDDPGSWGLAKRVPGRLVSFGFSRPTAEQTGTYYADDKVCLQSEGTIIPIMHREVIRLRGDHNLNNVLAACAIAHAAGLPIETMPAGVSGFNGVAHRLEWIRSWGGAEWYNDSIATAPERTMAAIRSFDESLVLLLGGRDKNLPWEDLASLVHERVDHVVVFGEAAPKILAAIGSPLAGERLLSVTHCKGLSEAVQAAAAVVQPGDVVLLSPGGTSFDQFRDFEERGELFEKWVKEL
jgi:UDP-N-acetylmuramoylalanine--D-glutamate ligase